MQTVRAWGSNQLGLQLRVCRMLAWAELAWCCTHCCRLSRAALVCRRLSRLACAPALLENRVIHTPWSKAALQALLPWLVAHAAHVRSLEMVLNPFADMADHAIATSCLVACATAGQLRQLTIIGISQGAQLPTLAWLPCMRSMRSLELFRYRNELRLSTAHMRGLTALHSLSLLGSPLRLDASSGLPPSLTRLSLAAYNDPDLGPDIPPQV